MDLRAAWYSRIDVQATGYDMTMPALHNRWAKGIGFGLVLGVALCTLLSSCLSRGAPDLGDRALLFEIKSLEGEPYVFNPVSGKVHLLYFWADWCPRCEDDFRLLEKMYQQWSQQRDAPHFVAIDVGQTEDHVRNFVRRMKTSFPIYMDHDGKVARSYGVKGLPTYFLIDGNGIIRHLILGWADEKTLLAAIAKIK